MQSCTASKDIFHGVTACCHNGIVDPKPLQPLNSALAVRARKLCSPIMSGMQMHAVVQTPKKRSAGVSTAVEQKRHSVSHWWKPKPGRIKRLDLPVLPSHKQVIAGTPSPVPGKASETSSCPSRAVIDNSATCSCAVETGASMCSPHLWLPSQPSLNKIGAPANVQKAKADNGKSMMTCGSHTCTCAGEHNVLQCHQIKQFCHICRSAMPWHNTTATESAPALQCGTPVT